MLFGLHWDISLQYLLWPLENHCCTAFLEVHFAVLATHCEVNLAVISSEKAQVDGVLTVTQRENDLTG